MDELGAELPRIVFGYRFEHERAAEAAKVTRTVAVEDPAAPLRARLDRVHVRVRDKIDKLGVRALQTDMPTDSYNRLATQLTAEQQQIQHALDAAAVRSVRPPLAAVPNLLGNWDRFSIEERRELLRALIRHVEVKPGHPRATITIQPVEN